MLRLCTACCCSLPPHTPASQLLSDPSLLLHKLQVTETYSDHPKPLAVATCRLQLSTLAHSYIALACQTMHAKG